MKEKTLLAILVGAFIFSSWWSTRERNETARFYEQQLQTRKEAIFQLKKLIRTQKPLRHEQHSDMQLPMDARASGNGTRPIF